MRTYQCSSLGVTAMMTMLNLSIATMVSGPQPHLQHIA